MAAAASAKTSEVWRLSFLLGLISIAMSSLTQILLYSYFWNQGPGFMSPFRSSFAIVQVTWLAVAVAQGIFWWFLGLRIFEACMKVPAFFDARPQAQPDFPEEMKH